MPWWSPTAPDRRRPACYAGLALADVPATMYAVAVSSRAALLRFAAPSPSQLASAAVDLYQWPVSLERTRVRVRWEQPADEPGYGIAAPAADAALHRIAREEGYLLDPIYTAKAAAALIGMAADGRIARGSRVLFLHTGGLSTTAAGHAH